MKIAKNTNMSICNWATNKDHARIILSITLDQFSTSTAENYGKAWSIPQPNLQKITDAQASICKEQAEVVFGNLLLKFEESILCSDDKLDCANSFSKVLAHEMVTIVGSVVGMKRATHGKGKYQSNEIIKARAEITTIAKARDLIRSLYLEEFRSEESRKETDDHLRVLLDRLCRMGLSIPVSSDLKNLHEWSETWAPFHIKNISAYISGRKKDMLSIEKRKNREMFLDCKKRGVWLEKMFGTKLSGCPNFAIDPNSNSKTFNPEEVKKIYFDEGAQFLKNKLECPSPFKEEEEIKPEPPPSLLKARSMSAKPKVHMLPRWWKPMYDRNAKKINADIWKSLMKPTDWTEVRNTICESDSGKAAGYDGVASDLVRLLVVDSKDEPPPSLSLLTSLINISFKEGQTLESWRKAIISMIPKRKDDGSFTSLV
jgi:hypothetical protein